MSIFESSESVSSVIQTSRNKPQVKSNSTDYRIVRVTDPVPCTTCRKKLENREEQVQHYHSDEHIERLRQKIHRQTGDIWKKPALADYDIQEKVIPIEINLDNSDGSISNISSIQSMEYRCEVCNQTMRSQAALENHLHSKKHKNNYNQLKQLENIEGDAGLEVQ